MSDRSQLEEISIKGLGVIEQATIELDPGFTVLTGETGAGKTMVLTALSLVLGGKADSSLVRKGQERLVASAVFQVPDDIAALFEESGVTADSGELILTRTLSAEGKSRATAGGVSVPAALLGEIGESLIEIHGQTSSMSITKTAKQREILDRYASSQLADVLAHYKLAFDDYHSLKSKIASLRTSASSREKEIASLHEFAEAFNKVKPRSGEVGELMQEISRLSSVEVLRTAVGESLSVLQNEEAGVVSALAQAKRSLESVAEKDPKIEQILVAVTESFFQLTDASHAAYSYLEVLEADPQRLEAAQSRRADLNTFLKRFGKSDDPDDQIEELIAQYARVAITIEDLSGGEDRLAQMEDELELLLAQMIARSQILSSVRADFANQLSSQVTEEIHSLSMPHTTFLCSVNSPDYSQSLSPNVFGVFGADEVSMLLQGHRDGPLVPVAKGASGGELSRVMLALEVVLAQSEPVGTYVFDEVDAGVGGKAAVEVGRRLHELSKHAQVIVVTHLAQVAAWADSHFVVRKDENGAVSQSDVTKLTGESRVEEIARMLAGHEDSQSAREHAAELLEMRG